MTRRTPELHWIPISIRIPEDGQMVGLKMMEPSGEILHTVGWRSKERNRWILPENPKPDAHLDAIAWVELPAYACPHCGKQTQNHSAAMFDNLRASPATCQHCHREFVIVGEQPLTNEDYRSPRG